MRLFRLSFGFSVTCTMPCSSRSLLACSIRDAKNEFPENRNSPSAGRSIDRNARNRRTHAPVLIVRRNWCHVRGTISEQTGITNFRFETIEHVFKRQTFERGRFGSIIEARETVRQRRP
jgi:hypothetical protein